MVLWDVNSAVVPNETIVHFHAAIVIERAGDRAVPAVRIPSGGLHILVSFFNGGHDHRSEVFWG